MATRMNLHVVWKGIFKVGIGERKQVELVFNVAAEEEIVAVVSLYIRTKLDPGWQLEETDVSICYIN